MPPLVPARLPRRHVDLGAELLGLLPFPAGGLPKEVNLEPVYPGYFLVRRRYVLRIFAHRDDANRQPFLMQYDIRRVLRGHARGNRRFARRHLHPVPKKDRHRRWQLEVQFKVNGVNKRTPYHRVVGLSVCPCTIDSHGEEVEPFQVKLGCLTDGQSDRNWEIHHGDWNPRNNLASNLYTLPREVHRRLKRPTDL